MDKKKLGRILYAELGKSDIYQEVFNIAGRNSTGKIWLVGGAVFRTLVYVLYGTPFQIKDWDFLVWALNPSFSVVGWRADKTPFGHPRFIKDEILVDIFPLCNNPVISEKPYPTIQDYLDRVPLTIQSIAYDIYGRTLIGDVGIQAILAKRVGVNHYGELCRLAKMRRVEPAEYLRQKAAGLGFERDLFQA